MSRAPRSWALRWTALWVAAWAIAPGPARADETIRARERVRLRLLAGEQLPLRPAWPEGAQGKPDEVSSFDLETLQIAFELGALGPSHLVEEAVFDLTLRATERVDTIRLLAAFFTPWEIVDADARSLRWRKSPEGELIISLAEPVGAGQTIALTLSAGIDLPCDDPLACIEDGPLRHMVAFGWYPVSFDFPLLDRFTIRYSIQAPAAVIVSPAANPEPPQAAPWGNTWRAQTERPTSLAAFAAGPYRRIDRATPALARVELYLPPTAQPPDGGPIATEVEGALELFRDLLGVFPFSRLGVTAVADEIAAGVGPQANILLPEALWQIAPDDPVFEAVHQVISHEIGHQWFYNTIAIAGEEDGWLSEGFAEYLATRYSEHRNGHAAHARLNYWAYLMAVDLEDDLPVYGGANRVSPFYFQIVYQKGSTLLHLLRRAHGGERFDEVLRRWVVAFTDQIGTTRELEAFLADALDGDTAAPPISEFFDRWVYRPGFPTFQISSEVARTEAAPLVMHLEQQQPLDFDGLRLPVRGHLADGRTADFSLLAESGGAYELSGMGPISWIEVDPELTLLRRVRPEPAADVNMNGVVDGMDLLDVHHALGRAAPDPAWVDRIDVNDDQAIDPRDVAAVIEAFGAGW